ncbi:MAG: inositol 2-dehydrogenase [bacterium]
MSKQEGHELPAMGWGRSIQVGDKLSKDKIVAGLIGAGRIGKMHASNILSLIPDVTLKWVADPALNEEWAHESGIPNATKDVKELLADPELEAVVIATSSTEHVAMIKQVAAAGKHMFCEKPIAFTPEEIDEAIEAVKTAGVKLQVGFNRRFDPDFSRVKAAVAAGEIGNQQIIRITNRDPVRPALDFIPHSGGLFMDFCIHDFDTVRYLSGAEVEEIFVMGAVLIDPEIEKLGDIDTALITLRLSNGALCIVDNSRETNYGYDQQIEVFGSKGSVWARNTTPTQIQLSTAEGVYSDKPHFSFVERFREAFVEEQRQFFSSVRSDKPVPVSGADAKAAVRISQAAAKSFEQNMAVRIES